MTNNTILHHAMLYSSTKCRLLILVPFLTLGSDPSLSKIRWWAMMSTGDSLMLHRHLLEKVYGTHKWLTLVLVLSPMERSYNRACRSKIFWMALPPVLWVFTKNTEFKAPAGLNGGDTASQCDLLVSECAGCKDVEVVKSVTALCCCHKLEKLVENSISTIQHTAIWRKLRREQYRIIFAQKVPLSLNLYFFVKLYFIPLNGIVTKDNPMKAIGHACYTIITVYSIFGGGWKKEEK